MPKPRSKAKPKPAATAPRNLGGRPRTRIDRLELEALCRVHATDEEIAAHFNCCVKTIERLRKNPDMDALMKRGNAHGKISLRRAQYREALKGDRTMLVWLGKQLLGQKDKHEHTQVIGPDQVRAYLDNLSDEQLMEMAAERGIALPDESSFSDEDLKGLA